MNVYGHSYNTFITTVILTLFLNEILNQHYNSEIEQKLIISGIACNKICMYGVLFFDFF